MRLLLLLALLPLAFPAAAEIAGPARAIAGDTLVIDKTLVRLSAIDAPEFDQTCKHGVETWNCGAEASQALTDLIQGGEVVCRDEQSVGSDTVAARCEIGGRDLALAILAVGLAVNRAVDDADYAQAERAARDAGLGLWSGEFMDPERWRTVMSCSCSARKKAFARNAELLSQSGAATE